MLVRYSTAWIPGDWVGAVVGVCMRTDRANSNDHPEFWSLVLAMWDGDDTAYFAAIDWMQEHVGTDYGCSQANVQQWANVKGGFHYQKQRKWVEERIIYLKGIDGGKNG